MSRQMVPHYFAALALLSSASVAAERILDAGELIQKALRGDDERYQAQVNALCNGGSDDSILSWSLANQEGTCSCQCKFEECSEMKCPLEFELEEKDGVTECARYETTQGNVIEPTEEVARCPAGFKLEVGGGRATCSIKRDCPQPDLDDGSPSLLLPGVGCDKCEYDMVCKQPAELKIRGGVPYCVTPKVVNPDTTKRSSARLQAMCPDGSQKIGDVCSKERECPMIVHVTQEAMACGPKTGPYLKNMLLELGERNKEADRNGITRGAWKSCAATCVAVFAKFSECAEQNDAPTCVGQAARSGKAVEAMGYTATPDQQSGRDWLMKVKLKDTALPCKDMYGSAHNFKGAWYKGVQKIEEIAADYNILMQGTYHEEPFARLSCRGAFCSNANTNSGAKPGHRSMDKCLEQCSETYGK